MTGRGEVELYHGDCLEVLPTIPSQSVDAVITDPPYPQAGLWPLDN
jgi:DNA modification methylase